MRRITRFFVGLLAALLLSACAAPPADDGRLRVVTTLFPYYDLARAVAGQYADVTLLLAPGREAHSFEPTPMDAVRIAGANVFLCNGGESELWVEELLESAGENIAVVLRGMDAVDAREEELVEGMQLAPSVHEHGHEHEHEHDDGDGVEYDEHIWTSPKNAVLLLDAVCDALCRADEAHAEAYRKNAENYRGQLVSLDEELTELRESAARTELIFADRFPFLYLCRDYDLAYRAAFHGCASDTEPSLATLRYLIDRVNAERIPVVLTVDLDSQKIAEAVSECTGASVATLCSMQTVSRDDFSNGETYVSIMRRNLDVLRLALQ